MDKTDSTFEDWFDILQMHLLDAGINFSDRDAAREDYDKGLSVFDVIDEIKADYDVS